MPKISQFYDAIWVYGPPDFYDPLVGLDVPDNVRNKMNFVGFLQRSVSSEERPGHRPKGDYLLVTTGGGGDGADLVNDVMRAYQRDPTLQHKALVVLGPYMPAKQRRKLMRRSEAIPYLEVIEFDNRMEELVAGATAVVAMGGYNTYCEILSFDKPALIVPRVQPREEQLIRARRATELGLVDMLLPEDAEDPARMGAALKALFHRQAPSQSASEGIRLEGLPHISEIVGRLLERREPGYLSVVKG
jgi:predicted glycosyltransferase